MIFPHLRCSNNIFIYLICDITAFVQGVKSAHQKHTKGKMYLYNGQCHTSHQMLVMTLSKKFTFCNFGIRRLVQVIHCAWIWWLIFKLNYCNNVQIKETICARRILYSPLNSMKNLSFFLGGGGGVWVVCRIVDIILPSLLSDLHVLPHYNLSPYAEEKKIWIPYNIKLYKVVIQFSLHKLQ